MVAQVGGNSTFNYAQNPSGDWVPMTTSASGAAAVTTAGAGGVGTDRSASVPTSAPVAGSLMPANANRVRFFIKNDAANNVWINLGGVASAVAGGGNIKVAAGGGYFELAGYTGSISAIAETSAANVTAREL